MNIQKMEDYCGDTEISDGKRNGFDALGERLHVASTSSKNKGIPYVKIGRAVQYALSDVLAFMNNHRISIEITRENYACRKNGKPQNASPTDQG